VKKIFFPFLTSEKKGFNFSKVPKSNRINAYLNDQKFIGIHKTENIYELVEKDDFHFLTPSMENGASIFGELWEVNDVAANDLRKYYENHSNVNEDNIFIDNFEEEDIYSYFVEGR
jgi:hypothetical protein